MMMLNITGFQAVFTGRNPIGGHYTTPKALLEEAGVHPDDAVVALADDSAAVAVRGREVEHPVRTERDGAEASVFLLEVRDDGDGLLAELGLIERFAAQTSEVEAAAVEGDAGRRPGVGRAGMRVGLLESLARLVALDVGPAVVLAGFDHVQLV